MDQVLILNFLLDFMDDIVTLYEGDRKGRSPDSNGHNYQNKYESARTLSVLSRPLSYNTTMEALYGWVASARPIVKLDKEMVEFANGIHVRRRSRDRR